MFESINIHLPVQISSSKGSGTGFIVHHKNYAYLVTAKHVIYKHDQEFIEEEISILNQCVDGTHTRHEINLTELTKHGNIKSHFSADICVLRLFQFNDEDIFELDGVYETQASEATAISITFDNMIDFNEINVGNDIYIWGYPSSIGIKNIPQIDYNQPLIRKGIISGLNKQNQKIIIDAAVYPGNSGGIISGFFNKNEDKIAGVISQLIPYEDKWYNPRNQLVNSYFSNSGYSVIEPMNFVKDVILEFDENAVNNS